MATFTHVFSSFAVPDVDAARRFYGDVLGLTVEDEPMGMIRLVVGDHHVMVYPKPDHEPATYTMLNLAVTDLDAAVDELGARGVTFERYDGFDHDDRGIVRGEDGPAIAWFTDPAGNVIALLEHA